MDKCPCNIFDEHQPMHHSKQRYRVSLGTFDHNEKSDDDCDKSMFTVVGGRCDTVGRLKTWHNTVCWHVCAESWYPGHPRPCQMEGRGASCSERSSTWKTALKRLCGQWSLQGKILPKSMQLVSNWNSFTVSESLSSEPDASGSSGHSHLWRSFQTFTQPIIFSIGWSKSE